MTTGARRGELCGLHWNSIDYVAGTVTIARSVIEGSKGAVIEKDTKTHAIRRLALDTTTVQLLREHHDRCQARAVACGAVLPETAYVFSRSPDGASPWVPNEVTKEYIGVRNGIGLQSIRLHDLRHFAATRLLAAGVPVRTVSGRLGHSNASTTLGTYAHFLVESDRDAANTLEELLKRFGLAWTLRRVDESPLLTSASRAGRGRRGNAHKSGDRGHCYLASVSTQVIVLNGASSSGKTSIARCLQSMLTTPWLHLGIDDLIRALPDKGIEDGSLLSISEAGQVEVGRGWRALESSWYIGVASIAASGTGVIVDDVLLDGGASQDRLRTAFGGLGVFWVGVKCDRDVARAREASRPDRIAGMAESQAAAVHEGVVYDVIVDTSRATSQACAAEILAKASKVV